MRSQAHIRDGSVHLVPPALNHSLIHPITRRTCIACTPYFHRLFCFFSDPSTDRFAVLLFLGDSNRHTHVLFRLFPILHHRPDNLPWPPVLAVCSKNFWFNRLWCVANKQGPGHQLENEGLGRVSRLELWRIWTCRTRAGRRTRTGARDIGGFSAGPVPCGRNRKQVRIPIDIRQVT
jgi:hypothetical protein